MDRYDIEPIEASDGPSIQALKYQYGDWVRYEDANTEIYNLKLKIGELTGALQDIYDAAYRVL